jgi:hypothetical protein
MNAKTRIYAGRTDGAGFVSSKRAEYSGEAKSSAAVALAPALIRRKPRPIADDPGHAAKSTFSAAGAEGTLPAKAAKPGRLSFITGGLTNLYLRMNQHWISKGGGNNRDVGSRSKLSP